MNRQEIFDKVVAYASTMTEPAANASGMCQYRIFNEDGVVVNKCLIGALIPDELYDPKMEDGVPNLATSLEPSNIVCKLLTEIGISEDDFDFCKSLQQVHDNLVAQISLPVNCITFDTEWFNFNLMKKLELFALEYNLVFNKPTQEKK